MDLDTELFRRVTQDRSLTHPTNDKFDPAEWEDALASCSNPTQRDEDLAFAALLVGRHIRDVRSQFLPKTAGVRKADAITCVAAEANRGALLVRKNAFAAARKQVRRGDGAAHIESMVAARFKAKGTGQMLDGDLGMESVIDALPHWYYHALRAERDGPSADAALLANFSAWLMRLASLERVYRTFWQQALWLGYKFEQIGDGVRFEPQDRADAERWQSWIIRQGSLKLQASIEEGVLLHGKAKPAAGVEPLLTYSVIGIERTPGRARAPIVGRMKAWGAQQRAHYSTWNAINHSYLAPLWRVSLPKSPLLTLEVLLKVWCVIHDLTDHLAQSLPKEKFEEKANLRAYSLPIAPDRLARVLTSALSISRERAEVAITFLTADDSDVSRLFGKGMWAAPLLRNGTDHVHLISGALLSANPVYIAEQWLDRGGLVHGVELPGKEFEKRLRTEISAAIAGNPMLSRSKCIVDGLPTADDGEEIDGLIAVRQTVLVVEAKCFITPYEPIERHNFMRKLEDACAQASKKANWLGGERALLGKIFAISEADAAQMKLQPVVITNQCFGCGASFHDVPVVDAHYAKLIFGDWEYKAESAIDQATGREAARFRELYKSEVHLEATLRELLRRPVVMKRFEGAFEWGAATIPARLKLEIAELVHKDTGRAAEYAALSEMLKRES